MKVLSAEDSRAWIKGRRAKRPGEAVGASRVSAVSPQDPDECATFACRLAETTGWNGGAVVLQRPVVPRPKAINELCTFRDAYGFPTTSQDIQRGVAPGHLLDDGERENQQNVARLLTIMLTGDLEGKVSTKSGRFVIVVGDGIIEFHCRDKAIGGKLRSLLRDLRLETFVCTHR